MKTWYIKTYGTWGRGFWVYRCMAHHRESAGCSSRDPGSVLSTIISRSPTPGLSGHLHTRVHRVICEESGSLLRHHWINAQMKKPRSRARDEIMAAKENEWNPGANAPSQHAPFPASGSRLNSLGISSETHCSLQGDQRSWLKQVAA